MNFKRYLNIKELICIGLLFLAGCGGHSSGTVSVSPNSFSAPLPSGLSSIVAVTSGSGGSGSSGLTAEVVVDNTPPGITLKVDTVNKTVSGKIDNLSAGSHNFTINYYVNGVLIASINTSATITAGSTSQVSLTPSMIKYNSGATLTLAGKPGGSGYYDGVGPAVRFSYPYQMVVSGTNAYVIDNRMIRKIDLSTGAVSLLAGSPGTSNVSTDGVGSAARFYYPNYLTIDSTGSNLYVVDNNTIRKITTSNGTVTTLAGSSTAVPATTTDGIGANARFSYPYSLVINPAGSNLYVLENNTFRRITISDGTVQTLAGVALTSGSADGTGVSASFYSPSLLVIDSTGSNLYVTDNQTIRKITSTGTVSTLVGSAGLTGFADGQWSTVRFNYPQGMALDSTGTILYVADTSNYTIRKFVISTGWVTTLAGSATLTGSTDGTGSAAQFGYLNAIVIDSTGSNLYVPDNATIRKITTSGGVVTTLAGSAGVYGSTDGTGSAARFSYLNVIVIDSTGSNLYVPDNVTIREITTSGGVVTTLAGTAKVVGPTDGSVSDTRFVYPYSIVIDPAGSNVYITDQNAIRKISLLTATTSTLAGSAIASGSTDGPGSAARFNYPQGMTMNPAGTTLYVADTSNQTIRSVDIASGTVTTLAGSAGLVGSTDGTLSAARFSYPRGITMNPTGNTLYIADSNNRTIRTLYFASATTSTLAGSAGLIGSTDGVGSAARFNSPQGLVVNPAGNTLYVTDLLNHAIRRVVISNGSVTTLAGTAGASGYADGTGILASFNYPWGLAIDATGSTLYVTDLLNHAIRRIDLSTGGVTTFAGSTKAWTTLDGIGTGALFNYPMGITTDSHFLYVTDYAENVVRQIAQ
jgi:DNA-binding beta-propeller fold protein YncE